MPNPPNPVVESGSVLEKASDGLSVRQAAEKIGVNPQTIRNWIKSGKLPATQFGEFSYRIAPDDLDKMRRPAS